MNIYIYIFFYYNFIALLKINVITFIVLIIFITELKNNQLSILKNHILNNENIKFKFTFLQYYEISYLNQYLSLCIY